MHNLVPHFILQQFAREQFQGQFDAASLFVDISGFSALTDALMVHGRHGAEVLATIMRAVWNPLERAVYEQGGWIANLAGDAFTALFPADQSQPAGLRGPARRALAAAWAMQQRLAVHARQATPYGEFALSGKVGLDAGNAEWGIVTDGDRSRAMHYVRGSLIDGSAAAQHQAGRGEILASPAFLALVQDLAVAAPAGDYFRVTALGADLPPARPIDLPPADPASMARFFPGELLRQRQSGEFRQVVNVFLGLPTVRTEPQLAIFMQSVFALQERFGGLLVRLDFGDKGANLVLFWGAPVSFENDIERALDFVLTLQAQTSIPMMAGVTYGIAHAGFVGGALREEYTAFGRGVNLAARFMTSAPRGEIWVDENVARRAGGQFDLEFEGQRAFKGFAGKQAVYVLLDRRELAETPFKGDLIGREAELAQLTAFAAPLRAGQFAGLMSVWGDAGMGKSRLLDAFRRSLAAEPAATSWALCQTDPSGRQSLNPFRYWLRTYFNQSHHQSEARNKRSFNRQLDDLIESLAGDPRAAAASLLQELDRTRSCLGALVDLRWPDSLYEQLDAQGRFENTLEGLKTLIKAESLRQPLILHLEDAHWLDGDSQVFLERLCRNVGDFPLAVVLAIRPADAGRLPDQLDGLAGAGIPVRAIELSAMDRADLARLAGQILEASPAPSLIDLLASRAEGNPFFAEQIVRYLQEQDLLVRDPEGRPCASQLPDGALPDSVHALLVARLDRLSGEVREAVQTAAVLGREFEIRLLARMLENDARLPAALSRAERAAIWSALGELRYLFRHALLRDTAYAMQVYARRRALHQLAAQAVETVYAGDLAAHYGRLAFHYEQAGVAGQARVFLELAAAAAADSFANREAVDLYSRALALTPPSEPVRRFDLLLAREQALDRLGRRDAQAQDLATLAGLAGDLADPARLAEVALRQANRARLVSDFAAALGYAQETVEVGRQAGDAVIQARGYAMWGRILVHQGRYAAAQEQFRLALDLDQSGKDRQLAAQVRYDLGRSSFWQGNYREALAHIEEAEPLYESLADHRGQFNCLVLTGNVLLALGEHVPARRRFDQALALCRRTGLRQAKRYVLTSLGNDLLDLGDYEPAQEHHEEALAICQEVGDRQGEATSLMALGLIANRLGRLNAAVSLQQRALAIQDAIGDRRGQGYAWTYLGHALADQDDLAGARQSFEQALAVRRNLDANSGVAVDDLAGLARVALAAGDLAGALAFAGEALSWLESYGGQRLEYPVLAYLICYEVFMAAAGQQPDAAQRASRALEAGWQLLQAQAAAIEDDRGRLMFLERVPFNRAMMASGRRRRQEGEEES